MVSSIYYVVFYILFIGEIFSPKLFNYTIYLSTILTFLNINYLIYAINKIKATKNYLLILILIMTVLHS